jgi:hypothetical protein
MGDSRCFIIGEKLEKIEVAIIGFIEKYCH